MKRYGEQLVMITLVLVLHFAFTSSLWFDELNDSGNDEPHLSWILDKNELEGDTLIYLAFDPFFNCAKTYRAFPLKENLVKLMGSSPLNGQLRVVFECTDGYKPHMPLEKVMAGEGYLAYKDQGLPNDLDWPESVAGKMAPFYLVWPNEDPEDKSWVTPYGLASIKIVLAKEEFSKALPPDNRHMEGYELFSNTCMRCHSVNKVGGTMAPELNFPKNITEYWTKKDIRAFIREPASYRYNAKMPPITSIDDEQFEKIYGYLQSMKEKKVEK